MYKRARSALLIRFVATACIILVPIPADAESMNDSQKLSPATSFAGPWRVESEDSICAVSLTTVWVENANAYRLLDPDGCLAKTIGAQAVAWRPAPDGLDLVGPDRLSVGFFAFDRTGFASLRRPGGTVITLAPHDVGDSDPGRRLKF
ncbi:AprI/Inh family metalloprotease inhibitor [Sphingomonas faeni]|uniref:AprI/Inh family metalloprotease inhibitor n=1 Tax=Sphingomonas faeni TaxID=185950 RepID=UPI00334CF1AA